VPAPRRPGPALTPRQRRLILVACILGSGIAFLDATVVNVALPAIRDDLGAGLSTQLWVVEAYLLTLGSLLLIGGSLGDILGRRRVFAFGTAAFGITSLLCALAPSGGVLIAARALQGVAGALLVPSTMGIIVASFDESERGRAIGVWTAWTGVATVIGPLGGGLLVEAASWRWIFAINLLPAALTVALILHALPPDPEPGADRPRVDVRGAALVSLGLAGAVFALIEQAQRGWGDPLVLLALGGGLALLGLFAVVERRERDPMVPFALFARRNFAAANLATVAVYASLGVLFFFLVLFLQQVAGYGPLEAGLALLPVTAMLFVLSRLFGALADRSGPRLPMTAGPLVAAAGLALMLRLDEDAAYASALLPALLLFGLGLAATVAPLTATVLGGVEEEHAGVASGINNAVARVAGLLAVAAVGAVVAAQFSAALDDRLSAGSLSERGRALVADARDVPLSSEVPGGLAPAERRRVSEALDAASVDAFRIAIALAALLMAAGGVISLAGVRDPRRRVPAQDCPGGALYGGSEDLAHAPGPGGAPAPVGHAGAP